LFLERNQGDRFINAAGVCWLQVQIFSRQPESLAVQGFNLGAKLNSASFFERNQAILPPLPMMAGIKVDDQLRR
jgi:hypothetical protein